jgi:hypothetical protein
VDTGLRRHDDVGTAGGPFFSPVGLKMVLLIALSTTTESVWLTSKGTAAFRDHTLLAVLGACPDQFQ